MYLERVHGVRLPVVARRALEHARTSPPDQEPLCDASPSIGGLCLYLVSFICSRIAGDLPNIIETEKTTERDDSTRCQSDKRKVCGSHIRTPIGAQHDPCMKPYVRPDCACQVAAGPVSAG